MPSASKALPIPKLPVFGWQTFAGDNRAPLPTLLDLPGLVFTTSGRAAIGLALKALGVGPGDRVLLPTYHCTTMVAPAVAAGARPVYYPITSSGSADLAALEGLDTAGVRAMLAVHYFGFPQPLGEVRAFCDRRGITLIEDCAHALFGETDGRTVGSWGDLAIASLTKFFPVPEGGCLVSTRRPLNGVGLKRREALAEVRSLANMVETGVDHDRLWGLNTVLSMAFGVRNSFLHRRRAESSNGVDAPRTTESELLAQFDQRLADHRPTRVCRWLARRASRERIVTRRRENYAYLARRFEHFPGARPLLPELPPTAVPYVFPLWVENPDGRYALLKAERFPVFRWDWLWPGTPALPGDHGLPWSRHVFQLPCHQDLSREHLDALVDRLGRTFERVKP